MNASTPVRTGEEHRDIARRLPLVTLAITAVALAAAAWPGAAEALEFSRAALVRGEWWRLVTGHLVHFGWSHLAWDMAAFLILGALVERHDRRTLLRTLLWSTLAISARVLLFEPGLATYRGMSALDSALFGVLLARHAREGMAAHDAVTLIASGMGAVAFLAKCGAELGTGTALFASGPFVPVPLAHLVGFVVGACCVGESYAGRSPACEAAAPTPSLP